VQQRLAHALPVDNLVITANAPMPAPVPADAPWARLLASLGVGWLARQHRRSCRKNAHGPRPWRRIMPGFAESTPDGLARLPQRHQRISPMREGIHPDYREVLFVDVSNGFKFVTRSCVNTRDTDTFEGKEYPLFKLDTSSESHPFYTGTQKSVDNMGGRVEKFRNRYGKVAR